MTAALLLAALALVIWLYLLVGRGMFWLARERDGGEGMIAAWPSVTAIVPARDEAETIAQSIGSLLKQDYPGVFRIVLVDDQSTDGTAGIARALDATGRLTGLSGAPNGTKRSIGGIIRAAPGRICRSIRRPAPISVSWAIPRSSGRARSLCGMDTRLIEVRQLLGIAHCVDRADTVIRDFERHALH